MFKNIFGDCFFEDDEDMFWKQDSDVDMHAPEDEIDELAHSLGRSNLLNVGSTSFGNNRKAASTNFFGF